ncbi:MAG: hypothetical protein AAFY42_00270 [Pseudomonadota bacterium]
MTDAQVEVIGWIAVVFLALAALLWLADAVFDIVKNDDQRKILNRTIGGTFLGGIVAGAVAVLGGDDANVTPNPTPSPTPTATNSRGPSATPTPVPTGTTEPTPTTTPSPSPTPIQRDQPEFSAEVREWAEASLPLRPFLDRPLGSTYPPCAERLRAAGSPPGPSSDAGACFNQLQDFNRQVLTQHRDRRAEYIPQLDLLARNERNEERWRYMRAEYASFTYGEDAENYRTLSAVFQCDEHLMVNLRDRGLLKERTGCPIGFNADE